VVCDLPGVGQNLMNHLSARTTFKVKDGVSLAADRDAVHFSLHYTAPGSSAVNDMVLRTSPVIEQRRERVPGLRTRYLTGDVPPERAARISCTLGLPDGSGYVRLASADLWIRQTVGTSRHVSGTCKMGPDSEPLAIVDQYCRVKGVQGLWVADASVMPRIPRSGGAHATVIMIGERVVDWIAAG
jgi:choline dehydrogenase-like flavoprotein